MPKNNTIGLPAALRIEICDDGRRAVGVLLTPGNYRTAIRALSEKSPAIFLVEISGGKMGRKKQI